MPRPTLNLSDAARLFPEGSKIVPRVESWQGPLCRILSCSDGIETELRPPNLFSVAALVEQGMWIYTVSGFVEYTEGDRHHFVGPGSVLAVKQPARGALVYRSEGLPWRRVYVGLTGTAALEIFDYVTARFGTLHALPSGCRAVREARRLCRRVAARETRGAHQWSADTYAWLQTWWACCEELLTPAALPDAPQSANSQRVALKHATVKEFAERLGYSPSYLSRRLKQIWRRNPGEHLRERRMEEATRLLRETRLPVAEISRAVGFGGSSAFCAAFKQRQGLTPLRYRHEALRLCR